MFLHALCLYSTLFFSISKTFFRKKMNKIYSENRNSSYFFYRFHKYIYNIYILSYYQYYIYIIQMKISDIAAKKNFSHSFVIKISQNYSMLIVDKKKRGLCT